MNTNCCYRYWVISLNWFLVPDAKENSNRGDSPIDIFLSYND